MEKYEKIKTIGSGTFGEVCLYREKKTNDFYAIKKSKIEGRSASEIKCLKSEPLIQMKINSPFVVKLKEYFEQESNIFLVLQYCPNGTLKDFITKTQSVFDEGFIWEIFLKVALGLGAFHKQRIIHRDIKAENIFMFEKTEPKIGDLGLSRQLSPESLANTVAGTPLYFPPEILSGRSYDEKFDIWSLGCTLYELCCCKKPFSSISDIISGKRNPLSQIYSQGLRNLVDEMLQVDPTKRPSIFDIFKKEEIQRKLEYLSLMKYAIELLPEIKSIKRSKTLNDPSESFIFLNPNFKTVFSLMEEFFQRRNKTSFDSSFKSLFSYELGYLSDQDCLNMLETQNTCLLLTLSNYKTIFSRFNFPNNLNEKKIEEFLKRWSTVSELKKICFVLTTILIKKSPTQLSGFSIKSMKTTEGKIDLANIKIVKEKNESVTCVCLIDTNRFGSSTGSDQSIRIWNLNTYDIIHTINTKTPIGYISCLSNGALISGGLGKIYVWDLNTYQLTHTLDQHTNSIMKVCEISKNKICSCSLDTTLVLYDNYEPYKEREFLIGHDNPVFSFIELKNSCYILSCSSSEDRKKSEIILWDESNEPKKKIKDVVCSPWNGNLLEVDGGTVLVGSIGSIVVLDSSTLEIKSKIKLEMEKEYIFSMIEIGYGTILCGGSGKLIEINAFTKKITNVKKGVHKSLVISLLMADENTLISCSSDKSIKIWK